MRTVFSVMLVFVIGATACAPCLADEYVQGYTRQDGTVVEPYYRSSPDGSVMNNYSYEGNSNPYTGATGSDRYSHDPSSTNYDGSQP